MSVTLATTRQEVSKRTDEFLAGTATGGSTTTVIDTNKLTYADDYWAECSVFFTSGTNNGVERRASAFAASSSTLTLYSAAAAVANGDTYELRRRFGIADVDLAINRAINVAAPEFREHVRVDMTVTTDTYSYAVPIASNPDIFDKTFIGLEYGDTSLNSTKPLVRLPPGTYEIIEDYSTVTNANVKTAVLKFNPYTGYTLRFIFDGPLANVTLSTDRIHLDLPQLEFLYSQASAELWRIEASRTADSQHRASALSELARAEAFADRLRKSLGLERKQAPLKRTVFRVVGITR